LIFSGRCLTEGEVFVAAVREIGQPSLLVDRLSGSGHWLKAGMMVAFGDR
jgi:hypothetical protein